MNKRNVTRFLVLFVCVLFPPQVFGNTINLAAGITVEPYIIEAEDSGFEIDIVREIFALEDVVVRFVYQPLQRTKASFKNGTVDGVMTIKANYPEIQNSFLSEEYISYHNIAITLQSRNLNITTTSDLKEKKVDAFKQAKIALGEEFELMAENNPEYHEMSNQKDQIAKLFAGHNDVIVLDNRIYSYHYEKHEESPDSPLNFTSHEDPVTFHNLFEPSRYRLAFKTEKMRDVFNRGLNKLQESGRYVQIIESYVRE